LLGLFRRNAGYPSRTDSVMDSVGEELFAGDEIVGCCWEPKQNRKERVKPETQSLQLRVRKYEPWNPTTAYGEPAEVGKGKQIPHVRSGWQRGRDGGDWWVCAAPTALGAWWCGIGTQRCRAGL